MIDATAVESMLDRAESALLAGNAAEALERIASLAGEPLPSSLRGRSFAIQVAALEHSEREAEAEQLIEDFMTEEAADFGFILSAGTAFSELGADRHAETFLENLCELDPDNPLVWHEYAIALGRMERFSEAVKAYDHALERDVNFAPALFQSAYCLRLLGDAPAAIDRYERYLALAPTDGDAWLSLAILHSERSDTAAAYEAYRNAIQPDSDLEDAYFNWGLTAAQHRDAAVLHDTMRRLEDLGANSWRAWILRAESLELEGKIGEAAAAHDAGMRSSDTEADPEAAAYTAEAAFRFALRNQREDLASAVEARVFDKRIFAESMLELLRLHRGESAIGASYQVVVRNAGAIGDIVYGVFARNPDEAAQLAQEFHRRSSKSEGHTISVHQLSQPAETVLGVYWRSDG